jgi:hypothetical protein
MADATYTPTTSSDLAEIWRKVQTKVHEGLNFMSEEWEQLEDLKQFKVDWTSREILVPLDITEGAGIASIPEGGHEARPSSPAASELSLSWVLFNGRFTVSKTVNWIRQRAAHAMIENQMKYQARKKVQDLGRHFGDYFFGLSTGYLAQTSTNATQSSGTYTLKNGHGQSTITDAAFIGNKFKVGDWVALIRSAALVTNAIGEVTAVSESTPSITVTWNGSVDSDDDDYVVKANSLENTTITGTDYNGGLVGLLDWLLTASVHGLSSSSVADWDVATSDTTGGRLTGVRIRKHIQAIKNEGGGTVDRVYIAQGVERDMISLQEAAVRYSDPMSMELDGSVKYGNLKFHATKRVPPGWAIPVVSKSTRRMTLLPKPDGSTPVWEDGEKVTDRSAHVFNIDFPCATIVLNRRNLSYFNGLTES